MKNKIFIKWILISLVVGVLLILLSIYFKTSDSTQTKNNSENEIRIVSLIPSLTQSIYYLNAQDKLIGCTNYCKTIEDDSIEVVSSVMKPNIEKIVSLRPNIVLASGLVSEKDVETLRKFGIRVETFISPKSFDEICTEFIRLGKLVDKEDLSMEIVRKSQVKIHSIQGAINRESKPKIFIQIGTSPIHAVIPNTFMDDYINLCGGINIASKLTSGTIGREFVIANDPDIIFIVTMGIVGEEEADQWKTFKQMSAVAKNKIFIINSDIACQPTPFTFIETLELMNKYIAE